MAFWSRKGPSGEPGNGSEQPSRPVEPAPATSDPAAAAAPRPPVVETAPSTAPLAASAHAAPDATAPAQPEGTSSAAPENPATAATPATAARAGGSNRAEAEALGRVMAVLLRSAQHRSMTLADIDSRIIPALRSGQFAVAEANSSAGGGARKSMPVGLVVWAEVSPAVSERLAATPEKPIALAADEWRSGGDLWVVEAAGNRDVIAALIGRLQTSAFKDRPIRMRVRNREGKPAIAMLKTPPPSAPPGDGGAQT